jgi:hypothetical protein
MNKNELNIYRGTAIIVSQAIYQLALMLPSNYRKETKALQESINKLIDALTADINKI